MNEFENLRASERTEIGIQVEAVHALFRAQPEVLEVQQVAQALSLSAPEAHRALELLVRDAQLAVSKKGKYALPESLNLVAARVVASRTGAAYARPLDGTGDMKIARAGALHAMHGDLVLVRRIGWQDTHDRCELDRIVRRHFTELAAVLREPSPGERQPMRERREKRGRKGDGRRGGRAALAPSPALRAEPCDRRIAAKIELEGDLMGARAGDIVLLKIIAYPEHRVPLRARVKRVFGDEENIGAQLRALIETHGIVHEFSREALNQARTLPEAVRPEDMAGDRRDFRDALLFTIDGADAKDFDDAVSLERIEGAPARWRLGVHIADVSHYVRPGGAIDADALERGTSVYLPGLTVPMLPEALSNGLCSLMPGVDRLAMSLVMTVEDGEVVDHLLVPSTIRSRARLTYDQVNALFEVEEGAAQEAVPEEIAAALLDMRALSRTLRAKRHARGSIDFDLAEAQFTLNERGFPVDLRARVRGEAERLIEDFMLLANEVVARLARAADLPFLYRVHAEPDPDRIAALGIFLNNLNRPVHLGTSPHPGQMQRILEETAALPEGLLIKRVMLRSLKRACYSAQPDGHYGLATRDYCHFTSPIRRYPDLTVHRMLKRLLAGELAKAQQMAGEMEELAADCSRREFDATNAERSADDIVAAHYMKQFIGQSFEGVVSGVVEWGAYVTLPNTVEGLAHVRDMEGDQYVLEEANHTLSGHLSGQSLRIGDAVLVRLDSVDVLAGEVNFSILRWPKKRTGRGKTARKA